ncbi:hypothetical protein KW800_00215 [Candidatus Parcubacteria bacterium]|nr:hypothetical protein [Candidatus Parcubacteria bacterium]
MQMSKQAMNMLLVRRMRGRIPSRLIEDIAREEARRARTRNEIERLFSLLTPIQSRLLLIHFGLEYLYSMPDDAVAKLLKKKSPRSVAQIKRWALHSLRKAADAKKLIQPVFV